MATIITRAGKGSPLTHEEVDANFVNLNNDKVETADIGVTVQPYDATILNEADIGTSVQAYDAQLSDIAGLTPTDNGVVIGNGTNFVVESGSTLRASLGLAIGTDVQAYDADLTTWAGKTAPTGTVVGTSDTQTLTNKTLTDPAIIGAILEDIYTITDSAGFEINPSNGTIQLITLGASRAPKGSNFSAGESVCLMVLDGTSYTLTWTDTTFGPSGVVWVGGSAPTLDTTKYTVIELWKVGTQVYGALVGAA